jgi:hypothetical protein
MSEAYRLAVSFNYGFVYHLDGVTPVGEEKDLTNILLTKYPTAKCERPYEWEFVRQRWKAAGKLRSRITAKTDGKAAHMKSLWCS